MLLLAAAQGSRGLEWTSAIAQIAAAIGTLAAIVVALYLNVWRENSRLPSLILEREATGNSIGYSSSIVIEASVDHPHDLRSVFLRVRNGHGRRTAHDVEVLLSAAWRRPDGLGGPHLQVDSRPLRWSYVEDPTVPDVTRISIPPGVERRIEFIRMGLPEWVDAVTTNPEQRSAILARSPDWKPTSHAIFATPPLGTASEHAYSHLYYAVDLLVTARDVDAVHYHGELRIRVTEVDADEFPGRGSVRIAVEWPLFSRVAGGMTPKAVTFTVPAAIEAAARASSSEADI
jgi:hypothetical protein